MLLCNYLFFIERNVLILVIVLVNDFEGSIGVAVDDGASAL
jgi:hypothetical protein